MPSQETLNMLTLAAAGHFYPAVVTRLYRSAGSATAVMEARRSLTDLMPGCPAPLIAALGDTGEAERRAEAEIDFCTRHKIEILLPDDSRYPVRLNECDDAPPVLFHKGTADLNARRIIDIVGTRHCTPYGRDMVRRLVERLKELCPDVLIVSGLAYGIDICTHREALDKGLDTVAVLAHGLDNIYPPRHRDTARMMIRQGGLLTEYFTNTNADKRNFLQRNRIVAGMSDVTVVVESASHGGGLVTARLARQYHRPVAAFPGRAGDEFSAGCNNLIRDGKALMITSADDLVSAMGWPSAEETAKARTQGIERQLFPELSAEERAIADLLQKDNDQHVNTLALNTSMPVGQVSSTLFTLEMKGVVKCLPGGICHLIK